MVDRNSSLKSILHLGSGSVLAVVVMVASSPVITRLYTPEQFATYAFLLSMATFFSTIAAFRYELAIVLPKRDTEGGVIFLMSLSISLVFALLLSLVLPFFSEIIFGKPGYQELLGWVWGIPAFVVASGIYQSSRYWLTRKKEFGFLAGSQVFQNLVTVAIQIGWAIFGMASGASLIWGAIIAQSLTAVISLSYVFVKYRSEIFSEYSWNNMKSLFKRYKNYLVYITPYTMISNLQERIGFVLLSLYGIKVDVGFYRLADRMLRLPIGIVSNAVRPVFFQKAAADSIRSMETIITRTHRYLVKIGVPLLVIFMAQSDNIFAIVFGEPWRQSGVYAAVLALPLYASLFVNWMDRGFDVLGQQRLAFLMEFVVAILTISAWFFGLMILKNVFQAIVLLSLVRFAYNVTYLFVCYRIFSLDFRHLFETARLLFILLGAFGGAWILLDRLFSVIAATAIYAVVASAYTWQVVKKEFPAKSLST